MSASNSSTAIGGGVGGGLGLLILFAIVAYVVSSNIKKRENRKQAFKFKGAAQQSMELPMTKAVPIGAVSSTLVMNPLSSPGSPQQQFAQQAPVEQPVQKQQALPEGWTQFGPDAEGDVWFVDASGNSHWVLPSSV